MELGTPPTILQQLCNLPFNYFSDVKLISVLYPTLICYCYDNEKNLSVLSTEVSTDLLAHFIWEKLKREEMGQCNVNENSDSGMVLDGLDLFFYIAFKRVICVLTFIFHLFIRQIRVEQTVPAEALAEGVYLF